MRVSALERRGYFMISYPIRPSYYKYRYIDCLLIQEMPLQVGIHKFPATQFDPCVSSVTLSIMMTTSISPVKGSGEPNQLLDVYFTPQRFPGCPACEPNFFSCS